MKKKMPAETAEAPVIEAIEIIAKYLPPGGILLRRGWRSTLITSTGTEAGAFVTHISRHRR